MSLVFPNVAVLGLSQDARFFDAGFQYASSRKLSIAGTVNDLTAGFGITGVWSGTEGVLATIRNNTNYQGLVINGVNFGSGRIDSISFDAGNDVRLKGYSAELVVYDSGNLFNFTGLYYSGIETTNFANLSQFSESYSFDRPLNGGYNYTHNATIQFVSGANQLSTIGAAQSLARTLFTGGNLGFAFYPGFTNKQGKRYVTETYDLIDNNCSFQETFAFDQNSGAYSATYTTSVQMDEKGVVSTTEQGNIQGIENPNYQKALSAVGVEMMGAYLRCSGAAQYYFSGTQPLVTSPLVQGRNIDIFNNVITYTISFDNSPSNQRTYFWDYTLLASKQEGVSTVTENGTVIGRGENSTVSFANAQNGFATVKGGIAARAAAMFVTPFTPATNYLDQKQESYSPIQAQVGYSYRYSNDPTLVANAGIRRKAVSQETDNSVYSYNKINLITIAEIIQNDYQSTHESVTTTVEMEGDKTITLPTYLATAISEINSRIPAGNDRYIGGASYTFSPNEGTVNVQLTWLYNVFATQTISP